MLIEITNAPRDYAWGSTTSIAELQGRPPGREPEAEIWLGDHAGSPATDQHGATLSDLGQDRLPYLVKILAAAAPLSIQVHPTKAQAAEGFARETAAGIPVDDPQRNYKDANHKPEIIVALSETFTALAGLRDLTASRRLITALGPAAAPLARRLAGADEPAVLRDALEWLLAGDAPIADLIASIQDGDVSEFRAELTALREIAIRYPGDPGVVVALLMNLVPLRRGQALVAPAGTLHAYLDGLGIEVMAASDNVLRGGLTPKHVDVAELLAIVDTAPSAPPVLEAKQVDERTRAFDAEVPDFQVLEVRSSESQTAEVAVTGPTIAVVGAGEARITTDAASLLLGAGRAAYAGPEVERLRIAGDALVYLALPGASDV